MLYYLIDQYSQSRERALEALEAMRAGADKYAARPGADRTLVAMTADRLNKLSIGLSDAHSLLLEYDKLRAENEALKRQNNDLKHRIDQTQPFTPYEREAARAANMVRAKQVWADHY